MVLAKRVKFEVLGSNFIGITFSLNLACVVITILYAEDRSNGYSYESSVCEVLNCNRGVQINRK